MTFLALVIPLFRVITGHPAGELLRLLCNWILPVVALIAGSVFAGMRVGAVLKHDRDSEETGLLPENSSNPKEHILFLPLVILISITPVIIIAILSATDTSPRHFCP